MEVNLIARTILLLYISASCVLISTVCSDLQDERNQGDEIVHRTSRAILESSNDTLIECIPSGISSFPKDFFSQEQRQDGGVLVHVIIAFYTCATIGLVCHDYFVPSLEIISERLKLPPDIAGATFMAIGTSAPELFASITGSFVTEGDIGVGTIIGSAVFNLVGVTGLVGVVLWMEVLDIDWYPIARDCSAYGVTILTLIWIISDNVVIWWESLILLFIFILYIIVIYYNHKLEKWSRGLAESVEQLQCSCCANTQEETPLLNGKVLFPEIMERRKTARSMERDSYSVEFTASRQQSLLGKEPIPVEIGELLLSREVYASGSLCSPPHGGPWRMAWWIAMYPAKLLLFVTIPDSRTPKLENFFPVTFLMSVIWIGTLSYLAVWMVTIIGYTLSVPDSVSGLTILAAGTSIPEIISSIIVAKNGFGNMAISNLVGSNTFDISFCLGAPWLLKTLVSEKGYLLIFSSAFTYTTATLLFTLVAFVLVFQFSGWKLNRTVGLVFLLMYALFLILACMYEMNVFGEINVKTCES